MRKGMIFGLVLGLCLLVGVTAMAQTLSLDTIRATVEIPDTYTILTPDTLEQNVQFLQSKQTSVETMKKTFQVEGILLQAWGPSGDTCLQITALQDVDAKTYFDIDQQTTTTRAAYRKDHLSGEAYKTLGISFDSAEWKKTAAYGRFLMLKYVQRIGGEVDHRGYARRTIRNGYTITLDMQVYDRGLSGKDNNFLNDVMDSWRFTEVLPMPSTNAVNKVQLSSPPPQETNTGSFKVEGTGVAGAQVIASVMGMVSNESIIVEDTASKSGKFSLSVKLPKEGSYVMTLTVVVNGETSEELVYSDITYDKSLLPVNFSESFPETLSSDKMVIEGTSVQGAMVQCIVNGKNYSKRVGANKIFSFSIPTAEEGTYSVTLSFSKKGLSNRRYSFSATREWSESEKREKIRSEAVKPAYNVLTSKLKGYDGRIMGYTAYVMKITQSGDDWVVQMAFRKLNTGYKDIIVVTTTAEPSLMVDTEAKFYGTCVGTYLTQTDDGEIEYPCFELLFWDN